MQLDARDYCWKGCTRDGTIVEICTAQCDARNRLAEHFASLSPASLRFRFFGPRRRVSDREISRFTEGNAEHLLTLIATVPAESPSRIVGVAQYAVTGHHADIACSVVDDHQKRGIGSLLLERVLDVARASGITEFDADLLESNIPALHLFEASGLARHRTVEAGIVHLTFTSEEAERRLLHRDFPNEVP